MLSDVVAADRLTGISLLAAGAVLLLAGILVEGLVEALVLSLVTGSLMAVLTGWMSYHALLAAVNTRKAVPDMEFEPVRRAWARNAAVALGLLVVLGGAGVLVDALPLVSGIVLGNGGAALWRSRRVAAWQEERGVRLLYDARPSWFGRPVYAAPPAR
ncbi:MAG: hypothetical protein JHC95_11780 [Solirubrobacteraceae bacterium]|nr:hypothetical protein [Solirubrobacteraceae bacterium]